MPLFLAGLLVRGGAVAPDLMEEALQRQVLYGGALDTNLMEIGAADETTLAPYLARASGLPLARPAAFESVEPRVRRAFPGRLAERHGIVPFGIEGRTLDVACCYPVESSLIDEISFMLSLSLRPHVSVEYRVRLAVERLYGQAAAQRFHALARRFGIEPPAPGEAPPLAPAADRAEKVAHHHDQSVIAARSVAPAWSRDEALAMLRDAPDRDAAIEVVLRFARRVFEYASAFVVVGGNLIGWDAIGPAPDARRRVEQMALPVEAPSILRTVVETGGRYLGPIPPDEQHAALLEGLGRRAPRSAFLQPVSIGERVVAVLLCDNGEKVVSPLQVSQVMVVVQGLAAKLESMIRARRGELAEHAAAAPPPPAAPAPTSPRPAAGATAPRAPSRPTRPPPPPARSELARRAVEALLAAQSEAEHDAAMATIAAHGVPAAELLVALLPATAAEGLTGRAVDNPSSPSVQALIVLGDVALPALLRAARSSSPGVRFWVAALLRRSRSPQAREALDALAVDPVPAVALLARGS